ncbi:MAG: tryptophan 7-halogenase [Pirellulaceae bacterium]
MRIAIVGGGTAGHMALAHFSNHWPSAELVHVFDTSRPTIGVGEGTTPDFVQWLASIGIGIDALARHCQATPKRGLRFEGWGKHQSKFDHEFLPRSQQAVHFSAAKLPELLTAHSKYQHIDESVAKISSSDEHTVIVTSSGKQINVDLVIDARGFPAQHETESHHFDWITTDSALVTKAPLIVDLMITRAIARPRGWIFCIPLANETSFGYVYNSKLSTQVEASDDFQAFLSEQGVSNAKPLRNLKFPNFVRRNVFDGRVFHIGNCASFLEPLEATAIGVITLQLHLIMHWRELLDQGMPAPQAADRINRIHEDTLLKVSIFIAWHYAAGSRYDTPFWQTAADRFHDLTGLPVLSSIFQKFDAIRNEADEIPLSTLSQLNTADDVIRHSLGDLTQGNFGGYNKLSFAQIASGLGVPNT